METLIPTLYYQNSLTYLLRNKESQNKLTKNQANQSHEHIQSEMYPNDTKGQDQEPFLVELGWYKTRRNTLIQIKDQSMFQHTKTL